MQVKERKGHVYTEEEDVFIEINAGSSTLEWIANQLGRTPEGVRVRMVALGVGNFRLESGAYSAKSLAEAAGVSHETVRRWIRKGLRAAKKSKRTGVHKEHKTYYIYAEDFWRWAKKNTDYIEFNKIPKDSITPEPKWVDEERKKQFYNLPKQRIWSPKEDESLWHLYYDLGLKQKDIAAKMNRTIASVEKRLARLRKMKWGSGNDSSSD